MAVRFTGVFYSVDQNEYQIDIIDPEFIGSTTTVDYNNFGISLSANSIESAFTGICQSKCDVGMEVTAANFALVNPLLTQNNEYYVKVYQSGDLHWCGILLQDLSRYPNQAFPYNLKLSFTDNLQNLKQINSSVGWANLIEAFNQLLSGTGIQTIYGENDTWIQTCSNWFEDQMHSGNPATTLDPLAYTRHFDSSTIMAPDGNDRNHFDVLNELCILFGLKLAMYRGAFTFIQVDHYLQADYYFHSYSKNYSVGTNPATATGVVSVGQELDLSITALALAGGEFGFMPAVEKAVVLHDTKDSGALFRKYVYDPSTETNGSNVVTGNGLALHYSGKYRLRVNRSAAATAGAAFLKITRTLKLKIAGTSNYFYTNSNGQLQWTTANDFFVLSSSFVFEPVTTGDIIEVMADNFNTTILPSIGTLSVEVDFVISDLNGNSVTGFSITDTKADIEVKYLDPSLIEKEGIEYSSTNTTPSKFKLDLGSIYTADGPNDYSLSRLQVYSTGGSWENSNAWRVGGSGSAYNLLQLLLKRVMELHGKPVKRFSGVFFGPDIWALDRFEYAGEFYVAQSINFDADQNSWSGDFLALVSSGVTTSDGSLDFEDTDGLGSTGVGAGVVNPLSTLGAAFGSVTSLSAKVSSGTVSSLSVNSVATNQVNSGDQIILVNPINNVSQTFTLSQDWQSGDTTLNVDPESVVENFPVGSYITVPVGQINNKLYNAE